MCASTATGRGRRAQLGEESAARRAGRGRRGVRAAKVRTRQLAGSEPGTALSVKTTTSSNARGERGDLRHGRAEHGVVRVDALGDEDEAHVTRPAPARTASTSSRNRAANSSGVAAQPRPQHARAGAEPLRERRDP